MLKKGKGNRDNMQPGNKLSVANTKKTSPVENSIHQHRYFTNVLRKYLDGNNFVKYWQLKCDLKYNGKVFKNQQHDFIKYLNFIKGTTRKEFNSWSKDQRIAYLINAYNALTIELIIKNYPIDSIKDTGSLFSSA